MNSLKSLTDKKHILKVFLQSDLPFTRYLLTIVKIKESGVFVWR